YFSSYGTHRHLLSFPTRRSSDLGNPVRTEDVAHPDRHRRVARLLVEDVDGVVLSVHGIDRGASRNTRLTNLLSDGVGWSHPVVRSEEHTSELQSRENLVCRLLLE